MLEARELSAYLLLTEGGSSKECRIHLRERFQWGVSQGWGVDCAHGRLGHVGHSRPKFPNAVTYEVARKAYDDLVKSKKKDGYTEAGPSPANCVANFAGSMKFLGDGPRKGELEGRLLSGQSEPVSKIEGIDPQSLEQGDAADAPVPTP